MSNDDLNLSHLSSEPMARFGVPSELSQLGSYSLTFRICPAGQRLSAPLVPLERFATRLKKRRMANQTIRIESTSYMETKEFCGAAWPSK